MPAVQHRKGKRHAYAPQRNHQHDERRHHRAGRAHHAEQHERGAEQDERPQHDGIQVHGDINGRAGGGQEQGQRVPVEQVDQRDQGAAHHEIERDAGDRDLADAIPAARADILRRHRGHRGTDGHGRHLDVIPQLEAGAVSGDRYRTVPVDEADHHQHGR
jgi:hypothetical protein